MSIIEETFHEDTIHDEGHEDEEDCDECGRTVCPVCHACEACGPTCGCDDAPWRNGELNND
jgi:uncharacterized OB-fold protein